MKTSKHETNSSHRSTWCWRRFSCGEKGKRILLSLISLSKRQKSVNIDREHVLLLHNRIYVIVTNTLLLRLTCRPLSKSTRFFFISCIHKSKKREKELKKLKFFVCLIINPLSLSITLETWDVTNITTWIMKNREEEKWIQIDSWREERNS